MISLILSSRKSHDVVEPLLRPQWWINCKPLASAAVKVQSLLSSLSFAYSFLQRARSGLVISPHVEAEWYEFLENMDDWCVSRQLWWGHRCPAYFVRIEGQAQDVNDFLPWICPSSDRTTYLEKRW
jgi:valyl-tRNA synthetase